MISLSFEFTKIWKNIQVEKATKYYFLAYFNLTI